VIFSRKNGSQGIFLFLLLGLCSGTVWAQPGSGRIRDRVEEVDPEVGAQMLKALRNSRYAGDFIFEYELRHFPHRGSTRLYRGTIFGTWNDTGNLMRINIENTPVGVADDSTEYDTIKFLIQNGSKRWIAHYRDTLDAPELLKGEALMEPLVPGLTYTPFDLQMPFLFWDEYEYEGAERIKGRPAHQFLMFPPDEIQSIAPELKAVRIALDENYMALLRVEFLDQADEVFKSFRILNFKKVADEWIVKSIDLVDEQTREKTRFRIVSAAMNEKLDPANFRIDALKEPLIYPASVNFDSL